MAIQVSYTAATGQVSPTAYVRVESVQGFPKQGRANIGAALYHDEAAARGGKAPIATLGIEVKDIPATLLEPARPDWTDFFAVSGASTRSASDRIVSTCYVYLKARRPEFTGALDV